MIVFAVLMFTFAVGDTIVNSCTNTGFCHYTGACVAPSDINNCIITRGGVNYNCTSPQSGFTFNYLGCKWTSQCADCRANGRFNPSPYCIWNIV